MRVDVGKMSYTELFNALKSVPPRMLPTGLFRRGSHVILELELSDVVKGQPAWDLDVAPVTF